ncbi:aromatic acid exporter family protein [Microlunatus sp. GCM10028923]|uniref:FUSC family protein n=1 Tax=Microlunatus sp. GCM10028923 TaxID=3273400 RepID=UPI003615C11F
MERRSRADQGADAEDGRPPVPLIRQLSLRAFDLSGRTLRRSRESAERRVSRWRDRIFMIIQCAVTAGLAWLLAQVVLGHPMPFFAPVAAIITLGFTFGQRLRRGIEVAIGVAVGVLVGDLFVIAFGTGPVQIILVCAIAMSLATLLGAGNLMIIQAGVQSIIVITLTPMPGQGVNRWLDAVTGCAIALLLATIAPSAPLRLPRLVAAKILQEFAATLDAAAEALRTGDEEGGDAVLVQARATETALDDLREATDEGLGVVRHSPFRRRDLPAVQAYADLQVPLDHASRNLRVLARRSAIALWRDETVPLAYLTLMKDLADAVRYMAGELYNRRLPTAAQARLVALGRASSRLRLADTMSAVVILAQLRSIITDLLELTGLDYAEARTRVPDMD